MTWNGCPITNQTCTQGCQAFECRAGWCEDGPVRHDASGKQGLTDDLVTCGGGLPGDPNGEQVALAVEVLVRKYEGAMLRETLREALTEAYMMGAQNILGRM